MDERRDDKLFDYDNFRTFLKDYFEEQKRMRAVFSPVLRGEPGSGLLPIA